MMPLRRLRSQLQTRKGRGRGAGFSSSCWVIEALAETHLGRGGQNHQGGPDTLQHPKSP